MATATKTREVTTAPEAGVALRTREEPLRREVTPRITPPKRSGVSRVLAAVVALLVVAGLAGLGYVVWDATTDSGTETTRTFESPGFETLEHARLVADVDREFSALQNVGIAVPTMAAELHEDVALLELVITGDLPVQAAQRAPYVEPDSTVGRDSWTHLITPPTDTSVDRDSWMHLVPQPQDAFVGRDSWMHLVP